MPVVDDQKEHIQHLVLSGYGDFTFGYIVLLEIVDPRKARRWLAGCLDRISYGDKSSLENDKWRTNVAFTCKGLSRLGLDEKILDGFSNEFREGPLTKRRLRFMGDVDESDPTEWEWGSEEKPGSKEKPPVHVMLLLYAKARKELERFYQEVWSRESSKVRASTQKSARAKRGRSKSAQTGKAKQRGGRHYHGFKLVKKLKADLPQGEKTKGREPFGFKDGIVQPVMRGRKNPGHPDNSVAAGEFLLGYLNERNQFPPSPLIAPEFDPENHLQEHPADDTMRDFGRNGSYLVYRQLHQHVERFWEWIKKAVKDEPDPVAAREWLAAKMVGRWKNGAALVNSPESDPGEPEDQDKEYFGYQDDSEGHRCPFGAHIRRSNPRDSLKPNAKSSTAFSNTRRILRRGRPYEWTGEKGLHFLCFNADIANQFEFIQHDWINNPKFDGLLHADADAITGAQHPKHVKRTDTFTVQQNPVSREFRGLERFVDVRGAAYFFMPSRGALEYLASSPPDAPLSQAGVSIF